MQKLRLLVSFFSLSFKKEKCNGNSVIFRGLYKNTKWEQNSSKKFKSFLLIICFYQRSNDAITICGCTYVLDFTCKFFPRRFKINNANWFFFKIKKKIKKIFGQVLWTLTYVTTRGKIYRVFGKFMYAKCMTFCDEMNSWFY